MTKTNRNTPKFIEGGISIDDRGEVHFVNDFNFSKVKRFYMVTFHKAGIIRAWHAHKLEEKYVFVVKGAAIVGAVAIDNFTHPSQKAYVHRHILSAKRPVIFYIPKGYGNGFCPLTADTQLIFFATRTLEQSKNDDYRYNPRYWDIWKIQEG